MTLWSHHVTFPRDRSHMRITEIDLNLGSKSKFTDHAIAVKCPYDEIPGIFKQETHSQEREVKKKYLYFV